MHDRNMLATGACVALWLQLLVSGCEGSVRESVCFKGVYLDVVLSLRTSRRQGLRSSLSCCCAVWIGCGCGWVGWSWWWVSSEFLGRHFSFRWVGTPWRCLGALYFIVVDRFWHSRVYFFWGVVFCILSLGLVVRGE